ncbi:MAG TPA: hypothetical protein VGM10_29775 [Actinocrinis sp.]
MDGAVRVNVGTLLDDPAVPLADVRAAADAAAGDNAAGARRAHHDRFLIARHVGDDTAAATELAAWLDAPRDRLSACAACEQSTAGAWHAARGEDGRAFEAWQPLVGADGAWGELCCDREPHGALAESLLPLVRLGRPAQAREHHLRGFRISRLKQPLCAGVGAHIEFCALTGNSARGLELLAQHALWLEPDPGGAAEEAPSDGAYREPEPIAPHRAAIRLDIALHGGNDPTGGDTKPAAASAPLDPSRGPALRPNGASALGGPRFGFLGGVETMLRLLAENAYDELPFARAGGAPTTVGALLEQVAAELDALAARFDRRNGTGAFADRLLMRRSRRPFLVGVALPARTELVRPTRRTAPPGRRRPAPAAPSIAELFAQARRRTLLHHPDADAAWKQITDTVAAGAVLSEDLAVELDEMHALEIVDVGRADGAEIDEETREKLRAGAGRLLEVAARYEALGDRSAGLRLRAEAAATRLRAGEHAAEAELAGYQAQVRQSPVKQAGSDDGIDGRDGTYVLLTCARVGFEAALRDIAAAEAAAAQRGDQDGEEPAGPASPAVQRSIIELEVVTAQSVSRGAPLLGTEAARMAVELCLASGDVEHGTKLLERCIELCVAHGSPWSAAWAELNLASIARARRDWAATEAYTRSAVGHCLNPRLYPHIALLLAEGIWFQDGREGEAVAPALSAAQAFAAQGDAVSEARGNLIAAEALAFTRRPAEAVALYEPALAAFKSHFEDDDARRYAVDAARSYASCLLRLDEAREAVKVLLDMAERVKDWPNQGPQAALATQAAEALEQADLREEAVAAYQRAADLWRAAGRAVFRIRCLRSAAWLLAGGPAPQAGPARALEVMDAAAGELVDAMAGLEGDELAVARCEVAESHAQRARLVLRLGQSGLLPNHNRAELLHDAVRDGEGAISTLMRLLGTLPGPGSAESERADPDSADPEAPPDPGPFERPDLLGRLAGAADTVAQLEGRYQNHPAAAARRLRALLADPALADFDERAAAGLAGLADALDPAPPAAAAGATAPESEV